MSTCILPNSVAQSTHEANRNQMKNLLCHIISLDILTPPFSDKYPNLASAVKLVLTLRHRQASVERGFSVNKAIITNNISTDCIVGKCLVRDYMLTNNLKPHSVQITLNSKVAFKSAHQKYQLAL